MVTARLVRSVSYPASRQTRAPLFAVRETGPADTPKPKLLDRVRDAIRARHYSRRTEKAANFTLQRTMGSRCSPPGAERGRSPAETSPASSQVNGATT